MNVTDGTNVTDRANITDRMSIPESVKRGWSVKHCWTLVALLAGSALFTPASTYATTFYERPFPEAVQEAPFMVRGKVGMKYTDWAKGADGSKKIYTFYELKVDEVFKGDFAGTSLIMRELGGEKDGIGMQISGVAEFRTGEDTVVMLALPANSDGSYGVRGMMMAKFNVVRGEDGGERLIGPGLGGGGHEHVIAGDTASAEKHAFTLDDLRKIVRDQGAAPKNPHPAQAAQAGTPTPVATPATPTGTDAADGAADSNQAAPPSNGFSLARLVTVAIIATLVVFASRMRRKRRK